MRLKSLGVTILAGSMITLFASCSGRGRLTEFSPEQSVTPQRVLGSGGARMIRLVTADSTVHTLLNPRLVRDTVIGIRDAGPPRRIPSDSVAYVEAFVGGGPPSAGGGELFRLGLLLAVLGGIAVCMTGACSP